MGPLSFLGWFFAEFFRTIAARLQAFCRISCNFFCMWACNVQNPCFHME